MATTNTRDLMNIVGPGARMTRGTKKKPPRKTGAMGTPKKKPPRKTRAMGTPKKKATKRTTRVKKPRR